MASIIRIKRSSGTSKPSTLAWGELGYVTGIGSFGGVNQYKDRVFLGDDGTNAHPVGGHYYTSMMEHAPGAIAGQGNTRNQDRGIVAITAPATNSGLGGAESLKVDQWNVDNIRIDSNTISSTDTDGDIILDPNGSGEVVIPDDTFFTFGDDDDARIEYDENGTNRVQVTGAPWTWNTEIQTTTRARFGEVAIEDNIISTVSGGTDTLYIDPYPDGLDSDGTVIIKGNLQVDGTSTIVNSNDLTISEPIITLGLTTTTRTITQPVQAGVSTITIDSVVGINTGDKVDGPAAIGVGATVTNINATTEVITISNTTTAGISTQTQLLFTVNVDTNTDRGVAFHYNTSEGASNSKKGFFGYIDQTNSGSSAVQRSWTYIPEATITSDVVTGTRGYLDIKGIYYQTGDYNLNGMVYFDVNGLQTSTVSPGSGISTSNFVMTTDSSNVPTWTSTLDGGSY